jgi:hypothetical protein
MRNDTDTRRLAVWLVGAMSSACACLFLACSCLGVRGWAATGRDTAPRANDPPPEMITAAPTSFNLGVGALDRAAHSRARIPHIFLRNARQQSTCTARACRYCSTVIPVPWRNSRGYRRNSSTP